MVINDRRERLWRLLAGIFLTISALWTCYEKVWFTSLLAGDGSDFGDALALLIVFFYPVLVFLGRKDKFLLGLALLDLLYRLYILAGAFQTYNFLEMAQKLTAALLLLSVCNSSAARQIPARNIWFLPAAAALLQFAFQFVSDIRMSPLAWYDLKWILRELVGVASLAFLGLWIAAREETAVPAAGLTAKERKEMSVGLMAAGAVWVVIALWIAKYSYENCQPAGSYGLVTYQDSYENFGAFFIEQFFFFTYGYVLTAGVAVMVLGWIMKQRDISRLCVPVGQTVRPVIPAAPVAPVPRAVAAPSSDKFQEVRKYKALLDMGILTEEEFAIKKKQLLDL